MNLIRLFHEQNLSRETGISSEPRPGLSPSPRNYFSKVCSANKNTTWLVIVSFDRAALGSRTRVQGSRLCICHIYEFSVSLGNELLFKSHSYVVLHLFDQNKHDSDQVRCTRVETGISKPQHIKHKLFSWTVMLRVISVIWSLGFNGLNLQASQQSLYI